MHASARDIINLETFKKYPNGHHAHISNGPTENQNGLIKRIKRVGFGFTNFKNYRLRSLHHAGRPNWDLRATITTQPR